MANDFDSNFTRQLARLFLKKFETTRVLSKNVDTQLLTGRFSPKSGTQVDFKRPTDYKSIRSGTGDITGQGDDIVTGKATGTVQDYFTVSFDFDEFDQSLKMDQQEELFAPAARRIVTDLEVDYAKFMRQNAGLVAGAYGTAVTTWSDIAAAGALMQSTGIPMDGEWYYSVNPFTQATLASEQRSMGAGGTAGQLISDSIKNATVATQFAGFDRVMTATTLHSLNVAAGADRAGTMTSAPDPTYASAKDTMTQVIPVTAFEANLVVQKGEVLQFAGVNRLNLSTRQAIVDGAGANILFTGVVTEDVTLGGAGEGNITIAGPAVFEATGAYNTVDVAPANGGVVTLLGTAADILQPNLFWHKQGFSIGSVPLTKLFSTDTIMTTEDGLQIRVSKGADVITNKQIVRYDMLPAYGVMNPFFSGQGWG